jgi:uncharacterized protein
MISRWLSLDGNRSTIVVGARRAGKTTLLKNTFPDLPYYTLDDYDLLTAARADPKRVVGSLGPKGILDEVQRVPELLIAVKHAIDTQGQTFLMTGSSALGLTGQGVETLAGRVDLLSCPTLCWGEELGAPTHDLGGGPPGPTQLVDARRRLPDAIRYGGFPEVVLAADNEKRAAVLRSYKNTYFTKDLLLLSNIENADALMALMAYLAIATGSRLEASNAAREAGLSFATTKKYLNVLIAARLVCKLYGFQYGPAKRFTRAAKYYFTDVGILEALGIELSVGQRFEAFVVSEIEKRRQLGHFQCDALCYYESVGGAEIDIVLDEPHCTTALEVKATRAPSPADVRHVRAFVHQPSSKPRRGILVHLGDQATRIHEVECLPITHLWRAR